MSTNTSLQVTKNVCSLQWQQQYNSSSVQLSTVLVSQEDLLDQENLVDLGASYFLISILTLVPWLAYRVPELPT